MANQMQEMAANAQDNMKITEEPRQNEVYYNQPPRKMLEKYDGSYQTNPYIYTTFNPDLVEQTFLNYLQTCGNCISMPKVSAKKYKVQFTLQAK